MKHAVLKLEHCSQGICYTTCDMQASGREGERGSGKRGRGKEGGGGRRKEGGGEGVGRGTE